MQTVNQQLYGVEPLQLHSTVIHSPTGPVGQLFAFSLGGSSLYPENAPTLAMEPGSPVTDVLLHW